MDKITQDLLADGEIKEHQIKRILDYHLSEDQLLETLMKVSVVSENFVKRYIVKKLLDGEYHLSILDEYTFLNGDKILEELARELEMPFVDLDTVDIDYRLIERAPVKQLQRYKAFPISENDLNVTVAFFDPRDLNAREAIQRIFPRKPIEPALTTLAQITSSLGKVEIKNSVKGLISKIREDMTSVGGDEEASSILQLIGVILKASINARGSDIHVEPTARNCVVRTRIDGHLTEMFIFDKDIYPPLASRLKLLSNLDIAEKRKPQDGRFSHIVNEKEFDFRISTLPITTGESIVMRILDKSKAMIRLEDAGMDKASYERFKLGLKAPYGIILVTGPTGSGKSTTLYGALNELRNVAEKIITVEDPVEYQMNLIQQVHVNSKVGLTFASALRSILRQDPDKIMIGEIRDQETLRIAIQAALTGHLVLSTLHTNDAVSAITRMSDMSIEPYLISGAVVSIEAQRLVRRICPHCKAKTTVVKSLLNDIDQFIPEKATFYKGAGCQKCSDTGYLGREMIAEVLPISEAIASMIAREASKKEIHEQAVAEGFKPMFQNGIAKALQGKTTVEEILRVAKL